MYDLEMEMLVNRHDCGHPESPFYEDDGDYTGVVPRGPGKNGRVKCRYCGNNRLRWKETPKGWRTFEGGVLHKCPNFQVKVRPTKEDYEWEEFQDSLYDEVTIPIL